jgi:hypothetical protein
MLKENWLPGWEILREVPYYISHKLFWGLCGGMIRLGQKLFASGAMPDFKGTESAELMKDPEAKKHHGDGTSGNFARSCPFLAEPGWFVVTARGSHKGRLGEQSFVLAKVDWRERIIRVKEIVVVGRGRTGDPYVVPPQPSTDSLLVSAAFETNGCLDVWAHLHIPSGLPEAVKLRLRYPSTTYADFRALRAAVERNARIIDLIDHDPRRKARSGKVDSTIVVGSMRKVSSITLKMVRRETA